MNRLWQSSQSPNRHQRQRAVSIAGIEQNAICLGFGPGSQLHQLADVTGSAAARTVPRKERRCRL